MDESDTVELMHGDHLSPDASNSSCGRYGQSEAPWESGRSSLFRPPLVSVEPVVVLTMFSVALHEPLSTQYLWARISEDLRYNRTKTSGCESSHQDALQKVQHVMVFGSSIEAHITLMSQVGLSNRCIA